MFTVPNKRWLLSPIPNANANPRRRVDGVASLNVKGRIMVDLPPPPQASLGEHGVDFIGGDGEVEAWRRFREAGFLNESVLLRKGREALGKSKKLEKDLREVRSQIAEFMFTYEKKLAGAQDLESGLEEKYLENEAKAHAADAKLAEASRKNSEINRKLDDLEARERKLLRESLSLASERKVHEKDLYEQREHLLGWEKRLQDSQKRLVESQRLLNEREDRANEVDLTLKRKQAELEETKKAIEASKKSLKLEEDDIHARINSLASKEKKILAFENALGSAFFMFMQE